MINKDSMSAAFPIADKVNGLRKAAKPLSGTPLETLCRAKPYGAKFMNTENCADGTAPSVAADYCNTEEHNKALSLVTDLAVSGIQAALYHAKNVVNPLIQEVVDKYESYVAGTVTQAANCIAIKPTFYPDLWTNPVLDSMVEKYDGVVTQKIKLSIKFPTKTSDEVMALIKTGAMKYDGEIEEYVRTVNANAGTDILLKTYQTIFSFENNSGITNLEDAINPFSGNKEVTMMTFLLATKLMADIPDGIQTSLADYQSYVSGIKEQAGRVICRIVQKRELDRKNKMLITTYPSMRFGDPYSTNTIEVNSDVYNDWLKDGGSPEVLFGAYASDSERGYGALLANAENYCKIWAREKTILDSKIRIDMKSIKAKALRKAFYEIIKALPENVQSEPVSDMTARVDHIVDNLDAHRLEDIYYVVRMLVCRAVFPNSSAQEILTSIDEVSKANPGMCERDAALIASIEYVSTWVASQIKCDNY